MQNIGVLYAAATPSAQEAYTVLQDVTSHLHYKITYARGFASNETTFDSDVLKMKAAGVQFVWFDGPDNYTATLNREFSQQNFKPISYMTAGYGSNLVKLGGPAVDGVYLPIQTSLFLGEDAKVVPEVATFDKYMKQIDATDSIATWGATSWASAALFVQALKNAGQNPTRASLETALNKITKFDDNGFIAPANPAANIPAACWLLAQVKNGVIQRVPPTPSSGFICSPGDQLPINGFTPNNARVNAPGS
jgi:ABC-type branched-subunit amino acid transport system substrate-binding protein